MRRFLAGASVAVLLLPACAVAQGSGSAQVQLEELYRQIIVLLENELSLLINKDSTSTAPPPSGEQLTPLTFEQTLTTNANIDAPLSLFAFNNPDRTAVFTIQDQPLHGSIQFSSSTGSLIYSPMKDYVGPDSFTYKANDGISASTLGTIWITVFPSGAVPPINLDSASTDSIPCTWMGQSYPDKSSAQLSGNCAPGTGPTCVSEVLQCQKGIWVRSF